MLGHAQDWFEDIMNGEFGNIENLNYEQSLTKMHVITSDLLNEGHETSTNSFTNDEVNRAISRLKRNKASDDYGLAAEHIKSASKVLTPILANLFNSILTHRYILASFKSSAITVIGEKGKNLQLRDN